MLFFRYVLRSLLSRRRANMFSILSVGLFVAAAALGLSYYLTLRSNLTSAPPENVIVVSKGAATEVESKLSLDTARKVMLLDGVKKEGETAVAARELVAYIFLTDPGSDNYSLPGTLRGIDERSVGIHRARVTSGTMPDPKSLDVMVGQRVVKNFPNIKVGYELPLPGGPGKVVGIFTAEGGPFDDEVWTPRQALELHLKKSNSSSLTFVAESAGRAQELIEKINESKDLDANAATVAAFRAGRAGLASIAKTVLVLLAMLSIVATFAITTTMNAAVMMRMPELATLAAIGIRKKSLARLVLIESTLLGVVGALVGVGLGIAFAKLIGVIPLGSNPVELTTSAMALAGGLALGIVAGFLAGVVPSIHVRRLDILGSLR